ncbi:MAG: hypothetical protein Q8M03_03510 [Legionella sp.]|nr:hypothetical protein [Legionella sp.]
MSSENKGGNKMVFFSRGYTLDVTKITADFIDANVINGIKKLADQLGRMSSFRPNEDIKKAEKIVNKAAEIVKTIIKPEKGVENDITPESSPPSPGFSK